jgi:hypothetical protein
MRYDVTSQFQAFHDAVQLLLPLFEQQGIPWKEGARYHDVDTLLESLFRCFVLEYLDSELELWECTKGYTYGMSPLKSDSGSYFSADIDGTNIGRFVEISLKCFENNELYFNKSGIVTSSKISDLKIIYFESSAAKEPLWTFGKLRKSR